MIICYLGYHGFCVMVQEFSLLLGVKSSKNKIISQNNRLFIGLMA